MADTDLSYKKKPAFISFLPLYLACSGISYLLIHHSPAVSSEVIGLVVKLRTVHPYLHSLRLPPLPYGIVLAFPFLVYAAAKLLWNLMTTYEITSSHIRVIAGTFTRKEQLFPLSEIHTVTFRQDLFEVPFGVGTLVIDRGGGQAIKGIYHVKRVVDRIREDLRSPHR